MISASGVLDLDAPQSSSSVPFTIYCALPIDGKATPYTNKDVTFTIGDATATAKASVLDAPAAKSITMKLPLKKDDTKITINLNEVTVPTNDVYMKVSDDIISINSAAGDYKSCTYRVNGRDHGNVTHSTVYATNGVRFTFDEVADAGSKIIITCQNTALSFKKAFGVPAVTSFQLVDTTAAQLTPRTSYALMNDASVISITIASVTVLAALLSIFA